MSKNGQARQQAYATRNFEGIFDESHNQECPDRGANKRADNSSRPGR